MKVPDSLKYWLYKLKPGVPKIVVIIVGASVWAFAAYRILGLGIKEIEHEALNQWVNYIIGIAGFIPFFILVFRKVSKRYVNRIINHKQQWPCVFGFFDLRGYLLMSVMITAGILVSHWKVIPELYKGTFFISLGLSLLASAVYFVVEGIKFVRISGRMQKNIQSNNLTDNDGSTFSKYIRK